MTNTLFGLRENLIVSDDVAIVGSGPAISGKGFGCEIDAAEDVVRFNGVVTDGFEGDVGSRTTMLSVGLDVAYFFAYPFVPPKGDVVSSPSVNRHQNSLILRGMHPDVNVITWCHEESRAMKNMQHANYVHLSKVFPKEQLFTWGEEKSEIEIKDNFQGNRVLKRLGVEPLLKSGKGMRTGLRMTLMFVLSGVRPKLYGFDVDPDVKFAKHFYDKITNDKVADHPSHDFSGEAEVLLAMHEKNLIDIRV